MLCVGVVVVTCKFTVQVSLLINSREINYDRVNKNLSLVGQESLMENETK